MKAFLSLLLLVFLASCSDTSTEEVSNVTPSTVQEQTVSDIDVATEALPDTDELVDTLIDDVDEVVQIESEPKIVELSTTYTNPAMEVVMNIEYDLDSEGNISEISVTSPNYQGMPEFNTGVQPVVGMSVAEASEYVVSGSSLTTPAFQDALKKTL